MRRFWLVLTLVAALALPGVALAAGSIAGAYTAKIATPSAIKGSWTLRFSKAYTYTIAQGGKVVVHGHYAAMGSEITLSQETGPRACSQFGDYHWKRTGTTIVFRKVSDPCTGRALVLGHRFAQTT